MSHNKLAYMIAFALIVLPLASATKYTGTNSLLNFTFDNSANVTQNTGTGAGTAATDYGLVFITGTGNGTSANCIDTNCQSNNGKYWANTYATQATTGGWSFWFKLSQSSKVMANGTCVVINDGAGNSKGDFDIGFSAGSTSNVCNGGTAYNNGTLHLYLNNVSGTNTVSTTGGFLANTWYHAYVKMNTSQIAIYINGIKNATSYGSTNQAFFTGSSRSPQYMGYQSSPWSGNQTAWDELKYFNVELSDQKIKDIYNNESGLFGGATDTCTAPAAGNNWLVNWADNCSVTTNTNIGTGNLSFNGTAYGTFRVKANLTAHNIYYNPVANSQFFVYSTGGLYRT